MCELSVLRAAGKIQLREREKRNTLHWPGKEQSVCLLCGINETNIAL